MSQKVHILNSLALWVIVDFTSTQPFATNTPILIFIGEGLDIVKVKELLREHLSAYDKWAPEIDRAVRWLAVLLGPMPSPPQYVENHVLPLSELPHNVSKFIGIPSVSWCYTSLTKLKITLICRNQINCINP